MPVCQVLGLGGGDIDYAMLEKLYGKEADGEEFYS